MIWRYMEAMQADEMTCYFKPQLADIMLYLEYVRELNQQLKRSRALRSDCKKPSYEHYLWYRISSKVVADKTCKSFHEHQVSR